MNVNPFHGAQGSLPLGLYDNVRQAGTVETNLAYATAFILLALVLILFVAARVFGRQRTKSGVVRSRLGSLLERGRSRTARKPTKPNPFQEPISITDRRRTES
jgi:phosphate transport system permease protein